MVKILFHTTITPDGRVTSEFVLEDIRCGAGSQ